MFMKAIRPLMIWKYCSVIDRQRYEINNKTSGKVQNRPQHNTSKMARYKTWNEEIMKKII